MRDIGRKSRFFIPHLHSSPPFEYCHNVWYGITTRWKKVENSWGGGYSYSFRYSTQTWRMDARTPHVGIIRPIYSVARLKPYFLFSCLTPRKITDLNKNFRQYSWENSDSAYMNICVLNIFANSNAMRMSVKSNVIENGLIVEDKHFITEMLMSCPWPLVFCCVCSPWVVLRGYEHVEDGRPTIHSVDHGAFYADLVSLSRL